MKVPWKIILVLKLFKKNRHLHSSLFLNLQRLSGILRIILYISINIYAHWSAYREFLSQPLKCYYTGTNLFYIFTSPFSCTYFLFGTNEEIFHFSLVGSEILNHRVCCFCNTQASFFFFFGFIF